MAKNITIVPGNLSPAPGGNPFITVENTGSFNIQVLNGTKGALKFGNAFLLDAGNLAGAGGDYNVVDLLRVGGVGVLNSTGNWVGPTTNIIGFVTFNFIQQT